jgi:hypothetical protein
MEVDLKRGQKYQRTGEDKKVTLTFVVCSLLTVC